MHIPRPTIEANGATKSKHPEKRSSGWTHPEEYIPQGLWSFIWSKMKKIQMYFWGLGALHSPFLWGCSPLKGEQGVSPLGRPEIHPQVCKPVKGKKDWQGWSLTNIWVVLVNGRQQKDAKIMPQIDTNSGSLCRVPEADARASGDICFVSCKP